MPIKWLLYWQPNAGTSVYTKIPTEVSQCVDGVKGGRWKALLTFYRPIARDLLGVSLPEQPNIELCLKRIRASVHYGEGSILSNGRCLWFYTTDSITHQLPYLTPPPPDKNTMVAADASRDSRHRRYKSVDQFSSGYGGGGVRDSGFSLGNGNQMRRYRSRRGILSCISCG